MRGEAFSMRAPVNPGPRLDNGLSLPQKAKAKLGGILCKCASGSGGTLASFGCNFPASPLK